MSAARSTRAGSGDPGRAAPPVAALATVDGPSALALVRISGAGTLDRVAALLRSVDPPLPEAPRRASVHHGTLRIGSALPADDPLRDTTLPTVALVQPAGASYTGEESVELFVPGVPVWVRAVLAALEGCGVAPAGPGEFTRRAFESGRIDLTRAESVVALIEAESIAEARAARRTLEGELADAVHALADRLHDLIALLEAGLDFADQEVDPPDPEPIARECEAIAADLRAAARDPDAALHEGDLPRVLLWGRTNAGKSTLLNAWAEEDRALVSELEGTTTDAVSAPVAVGDRTIEVIDLPGRKEHLTPIEERADWIARRVLEGGDPVLYLLAADRPIETLLEEYEGLPAEVRARVTAVVAQVDRVDPAVVANLCARLVAAGAREPVPVSALDGVGLDRLRARVAELLRRGKLADRSASLRFNDRQRRGAVASATILEAVREELAEAGVAAPELVVIDLRRAHASLEEITGEIATEETLTRIFSRFCVGK